MHSFPLNLNSVFGFRGTELFLYSILVFEHNGSCLTLNSLKFKSDLTEVKNPNFLKATSWGYGPEDGPDAWHNDFPVAKAGKRQSPIDIKTSKIVDRFYVTLSKPLHWSYRKDHCLNVENTGASWKVNVNGAGSSLEGKDLFLPNFFGNQFFKSKMLCQSFVICLQ